MFGIGVFERGSVLAATVLLLVACGGSTAASSSAVPPSGAPASAGQAATNATTGNSAPDACALITPQEASTAFGQDAGSASGTPQVCNYLNSGGSLTVTATQFGVNAKTAFDAQRSSGVGLPGFGDVTGVGDRAFVIAYHGVGQIEFIKGSIVVSIQFGHDPLPTVASLTVLGQAAASRV